MSLGKLKQIFKTFRELRRLPRVTLNLELAKTEANHPFFRDLTDNFYRAVSQRHPKIPLIRRVEFGYAVCDLRTETRPYSQRLDSAARRNLKKAMRLGFAFEEINYNDYLLDVTAIHHSAAIRQGRPMPKHILTKPATGHSNPPSQTAFHDYPYFGILKSGTLVAYAGCFVAGELCELQTIYGHADFLPDGVVPLLIASIGDLLPTRYPDVRYFAYGTYYGASETMKRFKRKFLFMPHRASWKLGA